MNRREMLMATAGLLLMPLVRVDRTCERDMAELLGEFCATPQKFSRWDVADPWAWHENALGTDGRVLIAVPGLHYVAMDREGRRPNIDKVFASFWPDVEETSWRKWQRLPARAPCQWKVSYCLRCERHAPRCTHCDGEGDELDPWRVSLVKCGVCHGLGYLPHPACPICRGLGEGFPSHEYWGDALLDAHYVSLARRIPGARWMQRSDPHVSPVLVRGDGGIRAMLMPCWDQ